MFDSGGNFIRAFGWDVTVGGGTGFEICTSSDTCKAGVLGGGNGQFYAPRGVALDGSGNIYVADLRNQRIQVFLCNELVNSSLSFNQLSSVTNNPPLSATCSGYVEEEILDIRMTNTSDFDLEDIVSRIETIGNDSVLGNAFGAPGTVGALLFPPLANGYTDEALGPGEFVDVTFEICKNNTGAFDFSFDVYGNTDVPQIVSDISDLIDDINDLLGETSEEAAILIEPLQKALDNLGDGNEKNNKAVCGKLKSFIKKVERFEKDGVLTTEEADDLIAKAEDIKDLHGCK